MVNHFVFVDAAGNYGFDFEKEDVSKYFVVTAIIVNNDHLEKLQENIEQVRQQYFKTEVMGAHLITNNRIRRSVVQSIADLDFNIYAIVVNKEKLYTNGGFGYKHSFFKYVHGLLYGYLFETLKDVEIRANRFSDQEFMMEFEKYINDRHMPNLFNDAVFFFEDREDNIFIQLTNIICDVLYEKFANTSEEHDAILGALADNIIRIEEWPMSSFTFNKIEMNMDDNYDEVIAEQSLHLVRNFIAKNEKSEDQMIQDQMNFLKFLLSNLSIGRNEYIYSHEIIKNINVFSKENISGHYLRNNIVAPLRDQGLLIASTTNGYKLPTSESDLLDFAKFSSSTILPMLSRLEKCRNRILTATGNELDIISDEYFIDLKRFLDVKYERV